MGPQQVIKRSLLSRNKTMHQKHLLTAIVATLNWQSSLDTIGSPGRQQSRQISKSKTNFKARLTSDQIALAKHLFLIGLHA